MTQAGTALWSSLHAGASACSGSRAQVAQQISEVSRDCICIRCRGEAGACSCVDNGPACNMVLLYRLTWTRVKTRLVAVSCSA